MSAKRRFISRFAVAAAGVFALSACSTVTNRFSDEENVGPCPNAFALYDAVRVVNFEGDGSEVFENVGFTAEIQDVSTLCRYVGDNPINADIELDIGFGRGPAAQGNRHTYTYWIAITRRDMAVIDKRMIEVDVRFPSGEDRVFLRERIPNVIIPRANEDTSGTNFEIILGFELTPEQLEFNREGKRFTLESAQ